MAKQNVGHIYASPFQWKHEPVLFFIYGAGKTTLRTSEFWSPGYADPRSQSGSSFATGRLAGTQARRPLLILQGISLPPL